MIQQNGYDIIGIGSPLIDRLANVDEGWLATVPGAKGGMELIDGEAIQALLGRLVAEPVSVAGGSAANTTFGLATLGMRCTFLGKLGQDADGELYARLFAEAGVDPSRFKYTPAVATGQCLCLITPDSERTMRTCLGAAMTLDPAEITPEDFAGCRHAHLEGYVLFNPLLTERVLECAKAANCTISLDLASFEVVKANEAILDKLLSNYIDIVFANEDEAKAYCGSDDPEDGLKALAARCHTAAVKLGAKGALLQRGDEIVRVDAERVDAIDTTGAGDLWAAGFLYAYFNNRDLATCGRHGAVTGAEVVQILGAAIPSERWNIIKEKLR